MLDPDKAKRDVVRKLPSDSLTVTLAAAEQNTLRETISDKSEIILFIDKRTMIFSSG